MTFGVCVDYEYVWNMCKNCCF